MAFEAIFTAIEESPIGTLIRESATLFPMIESIHVLALTFVVGSIAVLDLRLLGVHGRENRVTTMSFELLPWTWGAFGLALLTGALLFTSNASGYATNPAFQLKFVLMALAGANMLFFHFVTWHRVQDWDVNVMPPGAARLAGGLSLLFWIGVIAFGRWAGFL